VSLEKTLNAVSHLGAKQSISVVVAQPDERHANAYFAGVSASVLEWYGDTEHTTTSGSNEVVVVVVKFASTNLLFPMYYFLPPRASAEKFPRRANKKKTKK